MAKIGFKTWTATFILSGFILNAAYSTLSGIEIHNSLQQSGQQELVATRRTCHDLSALSGLKPPPGNPKTNPSRAFDQGEHRIYAQLYKDAECPGL
jgi:hypothetical protein